MPQEYVFLAEKEEMWARMLMQVLEDNAIVCTALPVYGAGFAARTGIQDRLKVFVPAGKMPQAVELLEALFSAEAIFEEE